MYRVHRRTTEDRHGQAAALPGSRNAVRPDEIGCLPVTQHTVDLLIVGAGPVGLYGAYYAGVRGLCTAVIDSLPEHGGQITAMYPDKQIFDIAGYPAVKGRDLVHALTQQAATADPVYLLGQEARELTTDGRSHRHHEHWRRAPLPRHCD